MDVINLDKLKEKPALRILSRIKHNFAGQWRDIGYELLTDTSQDVDKIERTNKSDDKKCFDMLARWLEVDVNASYSKLIDALSVYNLNRAIKEIKEQVYKP